MFRLTLIVIVLFALVSQVQAGMIATWNFEDDYTDSTGNGYDLSLFEMVAPLPFGEGKYGRGVFFNEGDDYLYSRHPDLHANRQEFSVGGWVRSSQTQGPDTFLFMHGIDHPYMGLHGGVTLHYDTLYGYVNGGINHVSSSGTGITVNDGKWHHIKQTLTPEGTNGWVNRLYFDGELIKEGTSKFGATGSGNIFTIGGLALGDRVATGRGFRGTIDEVFFADHAMTREEIRDFAGITSVPEPSTFLMMTIGMAGLYVCQRHKRSQCSAGLFPTADS